MQEWDDHQLNKPLTELEAANPRAVVEFAIACAARAVERCEDSDDREDAEETIALTREFLARDTNKGACEDASLHARDLARSSAPPASYALLAAHHAASAALGDGPSAVNRACAAAAQACLVIESLGQDVAAEADWQETEIREALLVARWRGHPPPKLKPTGLSDEGEIV